MPIPNNGQLLLTSVIPLSYSLGTDCHLTCSLLLPPYSRPCVAGLVIYRFSTQALALFRGSMTKTLPDEEDEVQATTKVSVQHLIYHDCFKRLVRTARAV